ncbi:hypothetical protein CFIICLFH_4675 [Methylobacterium goesingense]|nr:hypothetical protein CFIICLFH_4675 [Methylobacterium goesingense]
MPSRQGAPRPGPMAQDDLEAEGRDVFESREPGAGLGPERHEQRQGGLGGGEAQEDHRPRQGPGMELQHRRRDEAEGPLGPEEELLQVVARIVLAQALEPVPDPAVGQHHLEPENEVAGIAVGEHRRAARVGGEISADAAGALGGQRERKQHPGVARRRLDVGQNHPGLHRDAGIDGVEGAQPVQPRQGEDDAALGQAAADMAGIAPLRHHRHPRLGAGPHHAGDLGGVGGPYHRQGMAPAQAARFGEVRREVGSVHEHMGRADVFGEGRQEAGGVGHHGSRNGGPRAAAGWRGRAWSL